MSNQNASSANGVAGGQSSGQQPVVSAAALQVTGSSNAYQQASRQDYPFDLVAELQGGCSVPRHASGRGSMPDAHLCLAPNSLLQIIEKKERELRESIAANVSRLRAVERELSGLTLQLQVPPLQCCRS
jgi:hypothetical protein